MEILRTIWALGSATVRQVMEAMNAQGPKESGYTTVLKFMQIMHAKGLLLRDEDERTHIYRAAVPPEQMQREIVEDVLDRVFGGSALALVSQALGSREIPAEELAAIKKLLAKK